MRLPDSNATTGGTGADPTDRKRRNRSVCHPCPAVRAGGLHAGFPHRRLRRGCRGAGSGRFLKAFRNLHRFNGAVRSRPGSSGSLTTRRSPRHGAANANGPASTRRGWRTCPTAKPSGLDAWEGRQEYLDALTRAVGELEPEERALVTLFYYEEYSVSECAGITQMSESNIKVRLHRIRKKLYILVNTQLHGSEK